MKVDSLKWWQKAVFYQVYPRSFADGNGDGIGDIPGLISKLDYLQSLGIGAIWISPHYPSPMCDCGYDISDYMSVAPEYGTMDDFDRLIYEAHQRDIRIVLDLVLNHTSDQHPWFIESRSNVDNPKRDWYVWGNGKDGNPPNNWYSTFGGSAWEKDDRTGEYYYHFFFKGQPDLNWRNPDVKKAMFDMVRFWLDRGVDGFRLDAIGTIYEKTDWPNQNSGVTLDELKRKELTVKDPKERRVLAQKFEMMFRDQHDQPGVHELMQDLRKVIDEYEDRVLIGETDNLAFYGDGTNELHLVFNFPLKNVGRLTAAHVHRNQTKRLAGIPAGGWPCNTLGNHDSPRVYSQFGDGVHNAVQARLYLLMLLTLKGTPVLYNGEELGMTDFFLNRVDQFRDPLSNDWYRLLIEVLGMAPDSAVREAAIRGRDRGRTPLQWSNTANGGFCPANISPWLPVNPEYQSGINVEDEEKDPMSLLNEYRRMIHFRQASPALLAGEYVELSDTPRGLLAFLRKSEEQTCLVVLNMTAQKRGIRLPAGFCGPKTGFSTVKNKLPEISGDQLTLMPFEGVVL